MTNNRTILSSLLIASLSFACGPASKGGNEGSNDAGEPLTVTPASANVLTCETLHLTETGATGSVGWSVSPAGTGSINSTGEYTAPTIAPASPAVTATCTAGSESASAQLMVATAFPGTAASLNVGSDGSVVNAPFGHQFTGTGAQVYAGIIGGDMESAEVFASANSGGTFGAPTSYATGQVDCVSVAVDVGNPQVVYLVYTAGHGDSTGNTGGTVRLAVSSDGAQTFPHEYVIADSTNGLPQLICPDVISPAAGQVLVVGAVGSVGLGGAPWHVGTWISGSEGADIGPVGVEGQCVECPSDGTAYYSSTDTNGGSAETTTDILTSEYSAVAGTNGQGAVCIVFQYDGGNSPSTIEVQCSTNSGATWTAPVSLGAYAIDGEIIPTVAVSPSGTVAVTWVGGSQSAAEVMLALSHDGGQTFGTPIPYTASMSSSPSNPIVAWESDDILWLSQTLNANNTTTISIDKSCDDGQTWSGAVQAAENFSGSSLLKTSAGFVVGGDDTQTPSLILTPLGGL